MAKDQGAPQIDIIPGSVSGAEIHPKGLLEAISYIDQQFANEVGGCMTNSRFLTTKQRIEFMEVGFRSSFASGTVTALLTPIAIGCIEKYIPIFGNKAPSLVDQFCAFLLAMCFSIGYALFISKGATSYIGEYTRSMVRNLLGGMAFGAMLKAFIIFVAFHSFYFLLFRDANVLWISVNFYFFCSAILASIPFFIWIGSACQNKHFLTAGSFLLKYGMCLGIYYLIYRFLAPNPMFQAVLAKCHLTLSSDQVLVIYKWIIGFRGIFLTSAYFVLVSTMIFIVLPYLSYFWAARRNQRLFQAGLINKESKVF